MRLKRIGLVFVPVLLCVALLRGPAAWAYLGPSPAEADRLWFTILAMSPIQSGDDVSIYAVWDVPREKRGTSAPVDARIEVRDGDKLDVVVSVPLDYFEDGTIPLTSGSRFKLSEAAKGAIAQLADGTYFVAFICDGVRTSNVTELVIDSAFGLHNVPTLELVAIEPPPYRQLPVLGLRVNGTYRTKFDFTRREISADGAYHHPTISVGGGPSDLTPGARWLYFVEIDGFLHPRIECGKTHEYAVSFPGFDPVTLVAGPERPLGDAWDVAMQCDSGTR